MFCATDVVKENHEEWGRGGRVSPGGRVSSGCVLRACERPASVVRLCVRWDQH